VSYLIAEHRPQPVTRQQQELIAWLPAVVRNIWISNDTYSSSSSRHSSSSSSMSAGMLSRGETGHILVFKAPFANARYRSLQHHANNQLAQASV
jgi:hypothetical protein